MYSLRLRTITEEYNGLPWSWIAVSGVYAVIAVAIPFMLLLLVHSIILKVLFGLMAVGMAGIWYLKLRSPAMLDTAMRWIVYRWKLQRGKTVIPKHIVPVQFLKSIVPIERIHANGMIEFTGNRYAIMYRLFVPRRTGEDLTAFIALVTKNIVDRLYDGHVLKVFEMQRYTVDTSIKNQVIEAMNDPGKSQAQREHLNSIYQQLSNDTDTPTRRYIYASIMLGRFDTLDAAVDERDNLIPSLEDGLQLGCIGYELLVYPDRISKAYMRCMK